MKELFWTLITENRHFLKELKDLPFRRLSATEALAELEKKPSVLF
jgi:hypothetical protein